MKYRWQTWVLRRPRCSAVPGEGVAPEKAPPQYDEMIDCGYRWDHVPMSGPTGCANTPSTPASPAPRVYGQ